MDTLDTMSQQFTQPVFYKFRYTFGGQRKEEFEDPSRNSFQYKQTCQIIHQVISKYSERITFGLEAYNSKREPTFIHCHFHFESLHNKEAIVKNLKRTLSGLNKPCTGVKVFSLKPEAFVNETKFYQYPLKQYDHDLSGSGLAYKCSSGFTVEKLNEMRRAAHSSWLVGVQINQTKSDNSGDNGDTLFSRLLSACQAEPPVADMQTVYRRILQIYIDEDRPINLTTIRGYGLTISAKLRICTIDYLISKISI